MAQCDINALLANAACFICLPPGTQELVELQMLCDAFGGNTIYYGDGPNPDASVVPGDPLFPPVVVDGVLFPAIAYSLTAVYTPGSGSVLNWTWPFNALGQTQPLPITGLFLQKSDIADNLPDNNFSLYWTYITTRDAPDPELDWTTIHTWGPETEIDHLPTTYTDATMPPTNGYRAYRLILMIGPAALLGSLTPPGSHKWEIDWNSVVVCTPFTLNTPTQIGNGSMLTWRAPQLAVPFIIWTREVNPVGGPYGNDIWSKISISWTVNPGAPSPVSYRVFKTHSIFNPIPEQAPYHWLEVTGTPASPDPSGSTTVWWDSDSTSPVWYRLRVSLSDGSTVYSTDVGGTF